MVVGFLWVTLVVALVLFGCWVCLAILLGSTLLVI